MSFVNIEKLPRRTYTEYVTPIQHLKNFSKDLDGPNVYVKRDDLLGLTAGGNKTRKLEFLIADAVESGADTIITCGAVQSNHCRLTLSAAVKEGLKCILVLEEIFPNSFHPKANGNVFLMNLLGAEEIVVVPKGSDMVEEMKKIAQKLENKGRKTYTIPLGGSNEIGSVGYAVCAQEILQQSAELGVEFDYIVVTSGSGGTHAGLVVGLAGEGSDIPVLGISISRDKESIKQIVYDLTRKTAKRVGIHEELSEDLIHCFDEYVGAGYAIETDEMIESVQMIARTEGLLLDPVYTGKTFSGLIGLNKLGHFKKNENILFVHTGGLPTLFSNIDVVLKDIHERIES